MGLLQRMLFIAILDKDNIFKTPTDLYAELSKLITLKKRATANQLDNTQIDFCEYKPYITYTSYLDMVDPQNSIVVNWVPGCRMKYHMTALTTYQ